MDIGHTSATTYDIFSLKGQLKLSSIPSVSVELSKFVSNVGGKDIVLGLEDLDFIDTSGLTLFLNIEKKLKNQGRSLYLIKPASAVKEVLDTSGLNRVLKIIDSIEQLEQQVSASLFDRYKPYTTDGGHGLHRISCSCGCCGSKNVAAYLTDINFFQWTWLEGSPFPSSILADTGEGIDYFSIAPIVCLDCFMSSVRITDFNIISDSGSVVFKSKLDENAKSMLAKSIKKRKKLMEIDGLQGDNFFLHPRDKVACYQAYLLADFCARSIAVLKSGGSSPFQIGYLNYLAIKYADLDHKDEHIDNCRTWFTQAINQSNAESTAVYETAVSYFALLVANMNLKKVKEATQTYNDFGSFINNLPTNVTEEGIGNPLFWHHQAQVIWRKEIDAQSRSFDV